MKVQMKIDRHGSRPALPGLLSFLLLGLSLSGSADEKQIHLEQMLSRYGFPAPQISKDSFSVNSPYTALVFHKESRKLSFNDILIWLHEAPEIKRNSWYLNQSDAEHTLKPLLRPFDLKPHKAVRLVVLDPGHGGSDSGAISPRNVHEKKAVLDIARRTQTQLQQAGIKVRLTRDADRTLSLAARVQKARIWQAGIFVSIHLNSAGNAAAHGAETYLLPFAGRPSTSGNNRNNNKTGGNNFDSQNLLLAYYTQTALVKNAGFADRGVRRARYAVLKEAPCPAILVECGFLSNPAEEARIIKSTERQKIAAALAQGIMTYINRTEQNQ